jgi:hypothetical protein
MRQSAAALLALLPLIAAQGGVPYSDQPEKDPLGPEYFKNIRDDYAKVEEWSGVTT